MTQVVAEAFSPSKLTQLYLWLYNQYGYVQYRYTWWLWCDLPCQPPEACLWLNIVRYSINI